MGIPSYFSYIVRNHSSIIRKIKSLKDPVNNLYLDSNSIIYDIFRNIPMNGMDVEKFELLIKSGVCAKIEEYITANENSLIYPQVLEDISPNMLVDLINKMKTVKGETEEVKDSKKISSSKDQPTKGSPKKRSKAS